MPSLDKIKSNLKPSEDEKSSEEPFFLQAIANSYGCTEREFQLAFAETINETPEELDGLLEEQINTAKGFLNEWGAYFMLYKLLNVKQEDLEKACSKFLIISEKLPREEGERIVMKGNGKIDKSVKKSEKIVGASKKKPKLSADFKKKAEESFEAEVEAMMKLEGEKHSDLDHLAISLGPEKKLKKKLKTKESIVKVPLVSKTKGHKRSVIAILNGGEGSGKSKMAQTFPNAFTLDLEDKLFDLIDYDPELELQEGEIGERVLTRISEKREILFAKGITPEDDYVVGIYKTEMGDVDHTETELNIEAVIGWFMLEGYQYHDSLIIDVGKAIREASIRSEESKKGRGLGQYEYIPITKANKQLIVPLIHFCRSRGINLAFITHWEGRYEIRKNAQGYDESVQVGRHPDIKEWMRDLVTWRIDFLKPDESGYDEKFIIDFQKAPGEQYFKLDITNKNLYEIISNQERLAEEKEQFRQLRMKKIIAMKKEEKK